MENEDKNKKSVGFWEKVTIQARKVINRINPKTAFLPRIEADNFSEAYKLARQSGYKDFVWQEDGRPYNTYYKGSAEEQMDTYGISNEQLMNRNIIQNRLAENIYPFSYDEPVRRVIDAVIKNNKDPERVKDEKSISEDPNHTISQSAAQRMDCFRLYMGLPQKYNTLGISQYCPSKGKEQNIIYFKDNALNRTIRDNMKDVLLAFNDAENDVKAGRAMSFTDEWQKDNFVQGSAVMINAMSRYQEKNGEFPKDFCLGENWGGFTMTKGKDDKGCYLAYYDKWDLAAGRGLYSCVKGDLESKLSKEDLEYFFNFLQNTNTDFGRPFEAYDRIYYDPETLQPLPEQEKSPRQEQKARLQIQTQQSKKKISNNFEKNLKENIKNAAVLAKITGAYIELGYDKIKEKVIQRVEDIDKNLHKKTKSIAEKIRLLSRGEESPATQKVVQSKINQIYLRRDNTR